MDEFIEVDPVDTTETVELVERRNLHWKLLEIQGELKVEKGRYNEFGGYYSRSKEDILEAVKPLAHERGCYVVCNDRIVHVADKWVYVNVTASLVDADTGESVSASAWAREPESKPRMDTSQVTGSASSYAGKRALGNLFAIDDTADADQTSRGGGQSSNGKLECECIACGSKWLLTSEQLDSFMCPQCGSKLAKVL